MELMLIMIIIFPLMPTVMISMLYNHFNNTKNNNDHYIFSYNICLDNNACLNLVDTDYYCFSINDNTVNDIHLNSITLF